MKSCLICRKTDEGNKIVLGYSLCTDCRTNFEDLLNTRTEPECLNDPDAQCALYECPKCFQDKASEFDLFHSFRMKNEGHLGLMVSYKSDRCCVCQREFNTKHNELWMDLNVCLVSYIEFTLI